MRATSSRARLLPGLWAVMVACASNPAPDNWLPAVAEAPSDPYGAWILVSPRGEGQANIQGEFLSVGSDSVFVLLPEGYVRAIPRDSIARAQIAFVDPDDGPLQVWSIIGGIGTVSNGVVLGLTLPLWIIAGTLVTGNERSVALRTVYAEEGLDSLRMFGRYPGGMPPDLVRRMNPRGGPQSAPTGP
jgi:hypothetical protein